MIARNPLLRTALARALLLCVALVLPAALRPVGALPSGSCAAEDGFATLSADTTLPVVGSTVRLRQEDFTICLWYRFSAPAAGSANLTVLTLGSPTATRAPFSSALQVAYVDQGAPGGGGFRAWTSGGTAAATAQDSFQATPSNAITANHERGIWQHRCVTLRGTNGNTRFFRSGALTLYDRGMQMAAPQAPLGVPRCTQSPSGNVLGSTCTNVGPGEFCSMACNPGFVQSTGPSLCTMVSNTVSAVPSHLQDCSSISWPATPLNSVPYWTSRSAPAMAVCVASKRMLFGGGNGKTDLWSSIDSGASWQQINAALPDGTGGNFRMVCDANERVCITGGVAGNELCSTDFGVTWRNRVLPATGRMMHLQLLIPGSGELDWLLIGGRTSTPVFLNDVWRYDHVSDSYWVVCSSAPWAARGPFAGAYANATTLVVWGGMTAAVAFNSDVWSRSDIQS